MPRIYTLLLDGNIFRAIELLGNIQDGLIIVIIAVAIVGGVVKPVSRWWC